MAALCWIAVVLVFSQSIGNTLAVDQNYIERIADQILPIMKQANGQFTLAANIPTDQTKLGEVFADAANMIQQVSNRQLYQSAYLVAGRKTSKQHAEARVLDNIQGLVQHRNGKILVLYSFLSPCGQRCTDESNARNILAKIRTNVVPNWDDYAFVFSETFETTTYGATIPEQQSRTALNNLASAIGQNNIFRCYYESANTIACIKCYNNGAVVDKCVKN